MKQIPGQMSIFDFVTADYPDFNTMSESEAAKVIGDALGVVFKYNDRFEEYEAKKWRTMLTFEFDNYLEFDNMQKEKRGARFLSMGYQVKGENAHGGGAPCDSFDAAIDYLRRAAR